MIWCIGLLASSGVGLAAYRWIRRWRRYLQELPEIGRGDIAYVSWYRVHTDEGVPLDIEDQYPIYEKMAALHQQLDQVTLQMNRIRIDLRLDEVMKSTALQQEGLQGWYFSPAHQAARIRKARLQELEAASRQLALQFWEASDEVDRQLGDA